MRKLAAILFALSAVLAAVFAFLWWQGGRLEHSQDRNIRAAAIRHGLEPALVKAVVWRESAFNPEARGRAGELGLMQIREDAAREWADEAKIETFDHAHCIDPATNLLAGTFYLAKLMRRYRQTDDPLPYALADYNAGRSNVLRWNKGAAATNSTVFIEQIGFPATRDYVRAILARRGRYLQLDAAPAAATPDR